MSAITTHVLDTARGRPAAGVPVTLDRLDAGSPRTLGSGVTDEDGRARTLLMPGQALEAGTYRLTFDVASYFRALGADAFYPSVSVTFQVRDPAQHYHVPLLLSPYGYSTYRGS